MWKSLNSQLPDCEKLGSNVSSKPSGSSLAHAPAKTAAQATASTARTVWNRPSIALTSCLKRFLTYGVPGVIEVA